VADERLEAVSPSPHALPDLDIRNRMRDFMRVA
jgi:hypothetical protein